MHVLRGIYRLIANSGIPDIPSGFRDGATGKKAPEGRFLLWKNGSKRAKNRGWEKIESGCIM
jgi:hypothetical protein